MGDIDLAEVKQRYGWRLSFMGNLHTTDVMLRGSVRDVKRESLRPSLRPGKAAGSSCPQATSAACTRGRELTGAGRDRPGVWFVPAGHRPNPQEIDRLR